MMLIVLSVVIAESLQLGISLERLLSFEIVEIIGQNRNRLNFELIYCDWPSFYGLPLAICLQRHPVKLPLPIPYVKVIDEALNVQANLGIPEFFPME